MAGEDGRPVRRRGDELERAILDAAWAELVELGYDRLTMEGVAARARTSKPVLYRRWPGKAELVIAALGRDLPDPEEPPDTGELRADLLEYLHAMLHRFDGLPGRAVHGLLIDLLRVPELRVRFRAVLGVRGPVDGLAVMMRRAAARGEIDPARLTPRVIALPLDLVRDEYLLTAGPPSDEVVAAILDEVVLPLLGAKPVERAERGRHTPEG
ncbi:TetR/AcrR family transcriptional regulator [Kitasatospora sp. NPDC101183]|uniref:TetR/AcrR family transcriptional regulator n=1 Tax=Kitasatospora sp. NPDC101183 TaxID=3364100 RepID=UPI0038022803